MKTYLLLSIQGSHSCHNDARSNPMSFPNMANQDAVADSFKRQTASSGTSDDGLGSIECERVGISLGKNRQHVDRPQGQFANQEDLRNGILALSSSLAGIATACGKPSNGGGAETTPLSAETGEIVATVTRTLSEGLKKISGQTTGEKVWTPEAQGALQALRSQLCRELEQGRLFRLCAMEGLVQLSLGLSVRVALLGELLVLILN